MRNAVADLSAFGFSIFSLAVTLTRVFQAISPMKLASRERKLGPRLASHENCACAVSPTA